MTKALRYRLFGIGKTPAWMRATLDAETAIFHTEGVSIARRRAGRVPGVYVSSGVSLHAGAFAFTPKRVIGSIGEAKIVDVPFDVARPSALTTLELARDGLHVRFDLGGHGVAGVEGTMTLEFREEIPEDLLARAPRSTLAFDVKIDNVVALFGGRRTSRAV